MGTRRPTNSSGSPDEKMNVFLKVIKTVPLTVKRSDTIRNLKALVHEKEGISENFQQLFYGGESLKDDCKLVDCGIQNNSTLHAVLQTSGLVKLTVKIASQNKSIEVAAKSHDTIHKIKLMIQARVEFHLYKYTLLCAGKILEDSRTLASLDIKGEATLRLVFDPTHVLLLTVKLPTGEIIKVDVKIMYTVRDVKEIVGDMVDFMVSDYELVSGGKKLEDSLTLASYNIKEESVIEILPQSFQIFVKPCSGKTMTVDVCLNDTISIVKMMISQKIGPDKIPQSYTLRVAGKVLEDHKDLASLGVGKESTLTMVARGSLTGRIVIGHLK